MIKNIKRPNPNGPIKSNNRFWTALWSFENRKNKETKMGNCKCQQPGKLKDRPENCTPVQIKECHGDVEKHECECGCGGHGKETDKEEK